MSDLETSEQVRTKIKKMATEDLANHVLTREGEIAETGLSAWRIAKPGTGACASRIIFAPGMICIYGDAGEMVLRHSDRASLGWLRRSANSESYLLEKVSATRDEKTRFYPGDALVWCRDMQRDEPDDDRFPRLVKCINTTDWSDQRDPLATWMGHCSDQEPPLDDPPRFHCPIERVLWLFESLRCFVRLFNASEFAQ